MVDVLAFAYSALATAGLKLALQTNNRLDLSVPVAHTHSVAIRLTLCEWMAIIQRAMYVVDSNETPSILTLGAVAKYLRGHP